MRYKTRTAADCKVLERPAPIAGTPVHKDSPEHLMPDQQAHERAASRIEFDRGRRD